MAEKSALIVTHQFLRSRLFSLVKQKSWVAPLTLALGIRLILTLWLALTWLFIDPVFPPSQAWQENGFTFIPPQPTLSGRALVDVWLRWDAVKFIKIAHEGYTSLDSSYYAFFPGYPLLVRWITEGNLFTPSTIPSLVISGLILSTFSMVIALISFQKLVQDIFANDELSKWSLICWAVFPTSFFLFAPYSDALFSAFALTALLLMTRKRWVLAGACCALAGFTRGQGILLVFPLAIAILLDLIHQRRWPKVSQITGLLLSPAGWLAYKFWSEAHAKANLLQLYVKSWNNSISDPFTVFFHTFSYAFSETRALTYLELVGVLIFSLTILWMLTQKKFWAAPALLVYTITTMGSFVIWDCEKCSGYISILRYFLSLYPVFIGFGYLILKLSPSVRKIIVFLSLSTMFIASLLYSCWVFVG